LKTLAAAKFLFLSFELPARRINAEQLDEQPKTFGFRIRSAMNG
jgi:hypothetical protein